VEELQKENGLYLSNMSKLYFAYGSNMKLARLAKRAPSVKVQGCVRISGKQMVFNKISQDGSGKANIVDAQSRTTWGVLFEIDENDIPKLDDAEKGYDKQELLVIDNNEKTFSAFTYVSQKTNDGLMPYDWYLTLIIQGAEENNLPKGYVESLKIIGSMPDVRKKK
jgi:gamma-glutamylcyclotransferase (GGCT)/AIG2-like uncharacterized protein YtfP